MPPRQTGCLQEEQIERVAAVISAWSIRPTSGEAPVAPKASDNGLGKTFAAWAGILKIVESSHEKWKIVIVCPLGVVANWRSSVQWMGTNRWVEEVVIFEL